MSAPTPGPWECVPQSHGVCIEPAGAWLGNSTRHGRDVLEANARLIAAAPDLLEALKAQERADRIVSPFHRDEAMQHAAELRWAAIAKAEGRK